MKKLIISLLLFAAAGTFVLWYLFHDRDKAEILKNLNSFCEMVNKVPGEAPAVSALKTARADRIFAGKIKIVSVSPDRNMETTAGEFAIQTAMLRKYCERLYLHYTLDALDINGDDAHGHCTFTLTGKAAGKDEFTEVRLVEAVWQKINGKWLITSLNIAPVMQK